MTQLGAEPSVFFDRGGRNGGLDRRSAAITLGILALIIYGSLYPFDFHPAAFAPALSRFWMVVRAHLNRGDVLSNILLYLPLGFFAARIWPARPVASRVAVITAIASMAAVAIELVQIFDDGRSPSIVDATANGLGALLGSVAGARLRVKISLPMLLLAAWFSSRLIPFFPFIHFHRHGLAIHPLFFSPTLTLFDLFRFFALWLAAGALLEGLFGAAWSRIALVTSIALVLTARVVISSAELLAAEAIGAGLAGLVWIGILSRLRRRAAITCAIFCGFVVLDALRPFHFLASPHRFGWIPFVSFMDGPRESGSRVFLEKTFIYGSLVWLLRRAGFRLAIAVAGAFAAVFCLRLAQTYLPGRSAEMTDPAMVLILAGLFALLEE